MQESILLHHYPVSPFAEKIRRILGFKNLSWSSVQIPMIMPKPDLVALTGGHRRTPVMQIGADIYCDTALISDILEHLAPTPTLYPDHEKGLTRILAQWADTILFPVAMAYNFQPKGAEHVFSKMGAEAAKAFGADRSAMRGGAPRMSPPEATITYKSYLRRLSSILDNQPFLCGDQPSLADFSAFHPIWFTINNVPHLSHILDATPEILKWYKRISAFDSSTKLEVSSSEALKISANAKPKALVDEIFEDVHGIGLGSQVIIHAESFGVEPTQGKLLAATKTRFTIEQTDPRAGTVNVHFPRNGFMLKQA